LTRFPLVTKKLFDLLDQRFQCISKVNGFRAAMRDASWNEYLPKKQMIARLKSDIHVHCLSYASKKPDSYIGHMIECSMMNPEKGLCSEDNEKNIIDILQLDNNRYLSQKIMRYHVFFGIDRLYYLRFEKTFRRPPMCQVPLFSADVHSSDIDEDGLKDLCTVTLDDSTRYSKPSVMNVLTNMPFTYILSYESNRKRTFESKVTYHTVNVTKFNMMENSSSVILSFTYKRLVSNEFPQRILRVSEDEKKFIITFSKRISEIRKSEDGSVNIRNIYEVNPEDSIGDSVIIMDKIYTFITPKKGHGYDYSNDRIGIIDLRLSAKGKADMLILGVKFPEFEIREMGGLFTDDVNMFFTLDIIVDDKKYITICKIVDEQSNFRVVIVDSFLCSENDNETQRMHLMNFIPTDLNICEHSTVLDHHLTVDKTDDLCMTKWNEMGELRRFLH
jgi:hypothetical protein